MWRATQSAIPKKHDSDDIVISDLCACVCDCVLVMCCISACVGHWLWLVAGPEGSQPPHSTKNPRPRRTQKPQGGSSPHRDTRDKKTTRPFKGHNPSVRSPHSHRVPLTRDPPSPKAEATPQSFLMATSTVLIMSSIYPLSLSEITKTSHTKDNMKQKACCKNKDYSFLGYTQTVLRPGSLRKGRQQNDQMVEVVKWKLFIMFWIH